MDKTDICWNLHSFSAQFLHNEKRPHYFQFNQCDTKVTSLAQNEPITIGTGITNTGTRAGDEVVQLYVRHIHSKVSRPREELKGFERITLNPGETRKVQFELRATDLAHWDQQAGNWTVEPDQVEIRLGSSSADIREKTIVNVHP